MTWAERKQQLKLDILAYFKGAGKDKLIEICAWISTQAQISADIVMEWGDDDDDGGYLQSLINEKWSPQHRPAIKIFCDRLIALEVEARKYMQSQRWWEDPKANWARDDFEYEDFLDSCPKAEIVIAPDKITVRCFEFLPGFKERLPKGGKYQGSSKWEFPLTARGELEKLGLPVIKYPDVE